MCPCKSKFPFQKGVCGSDFFFLFFFFVTVNNKDAALLATGRSLCPVRFYTQYISGVKQELLITDLWQNHFHLSAFSWFLCDWLLSWMNKIFFLLSEETSFLNITNSFQSCVSTWTQHIETWREKTATKQITQNTNPKSICDGLESKAIVFCERRGKERLSPPSSQLYFHCWERHWCCALFHMAAHLHQTDSHKNECLLLSSGAR